MMLPDYHIIFIFVFLILLFFSIILIFIRPTKETCMAANVFILMNHVFGVAVMFPFANLMLPGFDSSGVLVENYYAGMYVFIDFFSAFFFINVMLNIYAIFLLMKLSIDEAKRNAELKERDSSWVD